MLLFAFPFSSLIEPSVKLLVLGSNQHCTFFLCGMLFYFIVFLFDLVSVNDKCKRIGIYLNLISLFAYKKKYAQNTTLF